MSSRSCANRWRRCHSKDLQDCRGDLRQAAPLPRQDDFAVQRAMSTKDGHLHAVAAAIALGHAIVVRAFHLFSRHEPYHELAANSVDEQRRDQLVDDFTRRIQRLGYQVQLDPMQTAEDLMFNGVSKTAKSPHYFRTTRAHLSGHTYRQNDQRELSPDFSLSW
jgi:hypothetical protein